MSFTDKEKLLWFSPFLVTEFSFCTKAFWLHYNKLKFYEENKDIKEGKAEHEVRGGESTNEWNKYDKKEGNVIIEYTREKRDYNGKRRQLLLYLLLSDAKNGELRNTVTGELLMKVSVDEKSSEEIFGIIDEMKKLSELEKPPIIERKKHCEGCSFFEYCWI